MKRRFRLEITGVIDDEENSLSTTELEANLDSIVALAMGNGLITGETSAVIEEYDQKVAITILEDDYDD